jgi:hypothetical protein
LEVASQFGVNSEDLGELARIGADSMSRAMFEITRAGLAFMRAQELLSLGHGGDRKSSSERSETENGGGFVEWINENGLAQQRVYESMRIAKFVTQLPQDQRDDVLSLGKVKVTLLASLPQEVIDQAAQSGNNLIDKADLMTVAELKEEVAALKRREANYDVELERAELKIKKLSATKKRLTELEPRTEDIRQECMALQLEAELPITSLQKLFEEVLNENTTSDTPESRLRVEQIYVTASIVAAAALDMLAKLGDLAAATPDGNDLPQRALGTHILTREEAQAWLISRPMIENRHEAEKAQRQEERDAAKPKGAGRPTGSKNKKVAE